ncbi:Uncharacterised protein [Shigella sonnei]|nr:Uncharacterised protein [Shigella sonnei]
MPTYLARVELYNAEPEDYEGLHKYMLSLGFRRTIPHGDGSYNQLPDGTYVSEKGGDIYQICVPQCLHLAPVAGGVLHLLNSCA